MAEEKKKKGFLSIIKESMTKSGGCCGSGETCNTCSPPEPQDKKVAQKEREKTTSKK